MTAILGPLLTLLTLLLPFLLTRIEARKVQTPSENIDAVLSTGRPVDVAVTLSKLYDESAGDSSGQPTIDVRGAKSTAL